MKSNQKGFSVVEILVVLVIVGLLGAVGWLVYDRQKGKTDSQQEATQTSEQKQEPTAQETEETDAYEGWKTFTDSRLSYSFRYPATWTATALDYDGKFGAIQLDTDDVVVEEPFGEITRGSRTLLHVPSTGSYTEFTGLGAQLKDNGTIKPVDLTLGGRRAIEYAYRYEGPEAAYIRLEMSDSQYIESIFESEGQESMHENYEVYKKILASIE